METHASLVVPKDGEELEVYCSTQSPATVQVHIVAFTCHGILGCQTTEQVQIMAFITETST